MIALFLRYLKGHDWLDCLIGGDARLGTTVARLGLKPDWLDWLHSIDLGVAA